MPEYIIGLDLGQASDYTALAILERSPWTGEGGRPACDSRGAELHRFDVRHLERFALGTSYPAIVRAVSRLLHRPQLRPDPAAEWGPRLAIDAGGVGRAIVDMFFDADMPVDIYPVTITGGQEPRWEGWSAWCPKVQLVGSVQAALQTGRLLVIPGLPLADVLKKELLNFQVKITLSANETYLAREGTHDDILLAVALALWVAENAPCSTGVPIAGGERRAIEVRIPGWPTTGSSGGGGSGHGIDGTGDWPRW